MNVPYPELDTNQPPLGGFCGVAPPFKSNGGELDGLFPPSPPPIETHVVSQSMSMC
jgi:hypothetical protein